MGHVRHTYSSFFLHTSMDRIKTYTEYLFFINGEERAYVIGSPSFSQLNSVLERSMMETKRHPMFPGLICFIDVLKKHYHPYLTKIPTVFFRFLFTLHT